MARDIIKAGSPTLFLIIKFLNLIFGLAAIALIALGIWLWRSLNAFTIIQILFIGLGLFEFLLVLFVWTAKTSVVRLRMYLFFMMILFVAKVTVIIVVFAVGQKIIIEIAHTDQEIKKLKEHLNIVTYYCIGITAIMLLEMAFVYCYIGSLRNRNFEFDYKFLDEGGNKMTLEQKNQHDRQKVTEKYNQKRQQLYSKYPKYRQYKEGQGSNNQFN